jgi:hypothetical protein
MENAERFIPDFFEGLLKWDDIDKPFVQEVVQTWNQNVFHRPGFQNAVDDRERIGWQKKRRTTSSLDQRYMGLKTVSMGREERLFNCHRQLDIECWGI